MGWGACVSALQCGRPGGENNKGSVDFWRRKKQVFGEVSALYGAVGDQ
jgi:hypothetical protein